MDELELSAMRLLITIDECGSLSAAARRLGISQPAATSRLRALEARHRISLVRRSSQGSRLTEDGLAVVAWCRPVLREAAILDAGILALSTRRSGSLRVAASLTIAEYLMPGWLASLHLSLPDVSVSLSVVNSADVFELVRTAKVSLGFVEVRGRLPSLSSSIVGEDRLVVIASPQHPWARRRTPLDRGDLLGESWVLRETGSGTRQTFEHTLRAEPRVALEANSTGTVIASVKAGVGPSVVSELAALDHVSTGSIVIVPVAPRLSRPLRAVWPERSRLRSPASDLVTTARAGSAGLAVPTREHD